MSNPNRKVDEIVNVLANRMGKLALVYEGWPNQKHKDLRSDLSEEVPEVSITEFAHWPNHLDVNVWAQSCRERDEISDMVMSILSDIKSEVGITKISARDITFEEKGVIRPGKWDIIEGSKPICRKMIQISLR
jgi:hypothetical protein